ncbi:MAG TPA: HEPN domain-containing protein [Nanoarchaeota archaeon]|nr:HEPN domain-containing protein [Nanoarchaeota archaeon]
MQNNGEKKTILVATVGTTKDPIEFAIEKHSPDIVFLAYGRPTPSQLYSPLEIVTEIKNKLIKKGIEVYPIEISQPENLEKCLFDFSGIVKQLNNYSENSKIIIDITGGTKIMSAAALHTFLTSFFGEFYIEYIGGPKRDEHGRVAKESMIERVTSSYKTRILEIIRAVENYEFNIAVKLSENLPDTNQGRFLKNSCLSLLLWDNFEYKQAFEKIKGETYCLAKIYNENNEYGKIPEIIIKLVQNAKRIINTVNILKKAQNGENIKINSKDAFLLVADILANAERRFFASNFSECVLRSYRSIEASLQIKLLELGINPWKPENIEKFIDVNRFLEEISLKDLPDKFSLHHCFVFLKLFDSEFEKIEEELKYIQQTRNYSFLEHGYMSVSKEKAEKCLRYAKEITSKIIGIQNIENIIEEIRI